jgi:hypothetical protein
MSDKNPTPEEILRGVAIMAAFLVLFWIYRSCVQRQTSESVKEIREKAERLAKPK